MKRNRPILARTVMLAAIWSLLSMGFLPGPGRPTPVQAGGPQLGTYPRDPLDDPDLDGLTNLQESIIGTDPNNSDTDYGGENDGSEVEFAQDPLYPADDEVQAMDWVSASPRCGAAVLTYDAKPEHTHFRLYRRASFSLHYGLVSDNLPATGTYVDTNLINDVTYYFRIMAVDGHGHRSAVSPAASATPTCRAFLPLLQR